MLYADPGPWIFVGIAGAAAVFYTAVKTIKSMFWLLVATVGAASLPLIGAKEMQEILQQLRYEYMITIPEIAVPLPDPAVQLPDVAVQLPELAAAAPVLATVLVHLTAGLVGAAVLYMMMEVWYPAAALTAVLELAVVAWSEVWYVNQHIQTVTKAAVAAYLWASFLALLLGVMLTVLMIEPQFQRQGDSHGSGQPASQSQSESSGDVFDDLNL
jgi:hypothetical protein